MKKINCIFLALCFSLFIQIEMVAQEPCEANIIQFDLEYCGETQSNIYSPPSGMMSCPYVIESSAWYQVEVAPESPGFLVNFEGDDCCEFQLIIGRFSQECSGDFYYSPEDMYCFQGNMNAGKYCTLPGIYYIYIGTTAENPVNYCLTVEEVNESSICEVGFVCQEAIELTISNTNGINCFNGCNIGNCGENITLGNCEYNNGIAWYKLTVPGNRPIMNVSVTSHDLSMLSPKIQFFIGNCSNLTPLSDCKIGENGTVSVLGQVVPAGFQIYIAISNMAHSPGNFELCLSFFNYNQNACLISSELFINSRSFNGPLEGPYLPDEEVNFTFNWDFTSIGNGVQWPHAIIPVFGNCWDLDQSLFPDNGAWRWFDEGIVSYNHNNSFIFTYADPASGDQKLCFWLDPTCAGESLNDQVTMPAGWYHLYLVDPNCGNDPDNPNMTWGQPCPGNCNNFVEFTLKTKSESDCFQGQNNRDCSIQIYMFSDFETGCWQQTGQNSCLADSPLYFDAYMSHCGECNIQTGIQNNTFEYCSCESTEIVLQFDGSHPSTVYNVSIDKPEGIIGGYDELSYSPITQELCNTTADTLLVTYFVSILNPINCTPTQETAIHVKVLPQLQVNMQDSVSVCLGDSLEILPEIIGTNSQFVQFEWQDGSEGESLVVLENEAGVYEYAVTITDPLGCTASESTTVEFLDLPSGNLSIFINEDSLGTITFNTSNPSDYSYQWSNGENGHFISDVPAGVYAVTVTNDFGCQDIFSLEFESCFLSLTSHNSNLFYTCEGIEDGYIHINAINQNGSVSFEWNDGFIGQERDSLGAGIFTVTATDEFGCESSLSFELEPLITVDFGLDDEYFFCSGDSIIITIENDVTDILWSNGSHEPSIVINQSGQYSVSAVSDNGCIGRDTAQVIEWPLPHPNLFIDSPYTCHDDTISICTDDIYTVLWSNGTPDICTEVFGIEEIGLQAWSSEGCNKDTTFILPLLPEPIEIDSLFIQHPSSDSAEDGIISISIAGGIEPYFFEWYHGDQPITSNQPEIENLTIGEYFVHISDNLGCIKVFGPFLLEFITSIQLIEVLNINVFPNPFNNQFAITIGKETRPIQLIIRNLSGTILYNNSNFDVTREIRVTTENWPSGQYTIELLLQEGKYVHKLIKH